VRQEKNLVIYCTVTVIETGDGFVTTPVPVEVTVTVYVRGPETIIEALAPEVAWVESPLYVAVNVLVVSEAKPFAVLATTFRTAAPPEIVPVPRVCWPLVKITDPDAELGDTVEVSVVVPFSITVDGVATSAVLVAVLEEPFPLPLPPQATMKPANVTPRPTISTVIARLRRKVNGAPRRTAAKTITPPLFQGADGVRFEALAFGVIVRVDCPFPPADKVIAGAEAETLDGVPFVEVTVVTNETVPA
jgi:hypothetical protein